MWRRAVATAIFGPSHATKFSTSAQCQMRAPQLVKVTNQKLEPAYLTASEKMVPIYPLINIQLKSYDFAMLEHYAKWVHHMLCALDVDVNDCWASPHSSCRVTRFKLDSAIVETSYEMKTYERNVQLSELPATVAPLVAELLQRSTPPGVWVRLHPHESQHDDLRYVPDLQLKELKQQLSEVGQDPDKRKRKVAPNPAVAAS